MLDTGLARHVLRVGAKQRSRRMRDCACRSDCLDRRSEGIVASVFSVPFLILRLSLHRLQQTFPRIGQPVFLEAAVGFVGDGVFDKLPVQQILDRALKRSCFAFQCQNFDQFVC